jgi:hypothetical protein
MRSEMIEVFKTDVVSREDAAKVLAAIHASFTNYTANFDLQDCDHVLRVCCSETIYPDLVIALVARAGYHAEVLADEYQDIEASLQMS